MIEIQPVEVLIERRCKWKKKPDDPETGKKRLGCENCGKAKMDPDHFGAPPSLNEGGSGMDRRAYQSLKKAWMRVLGDGLVRSQLPRGLKALTVEVMIGFSTYQERDEGNLRWMIEKALGDVLKDGLYDDEGVCIIEGGWLPGDSFWPVRRYSMGNLEGTHTPGESWTRLMIFPSMIEPEPSPHARDRERAESAQQRLL